VDKVAAERARYVLWFAVLAAALGPTFRHVKEIPQTAILGLFALNAISAARFTIAPALLSLLANACASILVWGRVLLWCFPPVTTDGHPVMAVGQTFFSLLLGILCGLLITRWQLGTRRNLRLERWSLHLLGLVLFGAAILRRTS
jgi:hypothetical protein